MIQYIVVYFIYRQGECPRVGVPRWVSQGGWYMVILGQYRAVLLGTWWYWVSIWRFWSPTSGWYLVILGQYRAVLVVTW